MNKNITEKKNFLRKTLANEEKIAKEIGYLKAVSEKYGFSVRESTAEEIEKLTLGSSHGGIIAITEERTIPCLSTLTDINKNGF